MFMYIIVWNIFPTFIPIIKSLISSHFFVLMNRSMRGKALTIEVESD